MAKGKVIIERLVDLIVMKEAAEVSYIELEKDVGFLVHLSRTFPAIFPYLHGLSQYYEWMEKYQG